MKALTLTFMVVILGLIFAPRLTFAGLLVWGISLVGYNYFFAI